MHRVVRVAIIASLFLWPAPWAWADNAAIPAFFTLASDQDPRDAVAAAPSTIQQVAAQSNIPQVKLYSVSNITDQNSNAAPSGNSSATSASSCEQCSASACNQCGNNCNGCADACGRGCCDGGCCDCFRPTWTFKAGALVLDRVSPGSTALVVETGTGHSLMNASGFSFNWNGGVDVSIIRHLGDDNELEVRYFGINNWTAFQRFVTTTPAEIPVTPPVPIVPIVLPPEPQQAPPNVTSRFDTNLYNAEVNWHHATSDTMGWLAGFRWMQVHDALGITTPDATVRSVTDNQLFGGQIGGDLKIWEEGGPLRFDTVLKAGLYGNDASDQFESHNQLAFVGEVGVNIVYQCCDHVALSAGYELLWLDGIAVASDQIPHLNFINQSGLDSGGNAFYHGAMFSVNCAW
jgi:hypothetical protein